MAKKMGKLSLALLSGGMLTSGPVLAACSSGPSFEDWAATDGAAGRINLDDVQEAFKKSQSATDFEQKVNQIYEGDGIILIRARQDGGALTLEGWEDLNNNVQIDDAEDDLLFSLVKEGEQHNLRGHGTNNYYNRGFGAGDFLFTYMLISAISPRGYYYSTPVGRGTTIRNQRTSYRRSSGYNNQVSRNSRYASRQKGFANSRYNSAGQNTSSARNTYRQTSQRSGTFKSSSAVSRSKSGVARSRGGGGGSPRGGQVVIGFRRKRASNSRR